MTSSCEPLRTSRVESILAAERLGREDLVSLLASTDAEAIRQHAYALKVAECGPGIYLRGLIEIGNRCVKNCSYCGLRRDLRIRRYAMSRPEILDCVRMVAEAEYGSVVLQGGEQTDRRFVAFIESVVTSIRSLTGDAFGITLAFGEQTRETYRRWLDAGANRYLLRIETSSERLYQRLHSEDHSFRARVRALHDLKELGYQLGSGVMIGFPGQTLEDLADDLLFLRAMDVDMVGMGPYLVHRDTPLGQRAPEGENVRDARLRLALRMISVARIFLRDVNIASTTALQVIHPFGRELGLLAGANVLMPAVTPPDLRRHYLLYDADRGSATETRADIEARLESIGELAAFGVPGHPRHYGRMQR